MSFIDSRQEVSSDYPRRSTPDSFIPSRGAESTNTLRLNRESLHYDHATASNRNLASVINHGESSLVKRYAAWILASRSFDLTVGMVILINSVCIGLEQTYRIQQQSTHMIDVFEHFFLAIYVFEITLRFYVLGCQALRDNWVKFDLFLVVTSIITQWIIGPFLGDQLSQGVAPLMVLRTARLARLARALRLLVKFRELWMLIRGLLASAKMVIYTLILLVIILYMFAAVGIEVIRLDPTYTSGKDAIQEPEYREAVNRYFPTLPEALLTLVQFIAVDDVNQIYRPLIKYRVWLVGYFLSLILVVAVVVMNIIIAVLVNGALEQADQEKLALKVKSDKKKRRLLNQLMQVLAGHDVDGSGQISREDLVTAADNEKALLHDVIHSPLEVFDSLDVDDTGCLDIEEFIEGLYEVAVCRNPIVWKRMDKRINGVSKDQRDVKRQLTELRAIIAKSMAALEARALQFHGGTCLNSHDNSMSSTKGVQEFDVIDKGTSLSEETPSQLRLPQPPSAARQVSCCQAAQNEQALLTEVTMEISQLGACTQRLSAACQRCISRTNAAATISADPLNTNRANSGPRVKFIELPFTAEFAVETPAPLPDTIFNKVCISAGATESCLSAEADTKQGTDGKDDFVVRSCHDNVDQMTAPFHMDTSGLVLSPMLAPPMISATRKFPRVSHPVQTPQSSGNEC